MSDLGFPELPPQRSIAEERLAHRRLLLERHVVTSAAEAARKPWWRRKIMIIPVAAVVAASATAAGSTLLPGDVATKATTVGCYTSVSLQGDVDIIGGDAVVDPAESCRNVWRSAGMDVPSELASCLAPGGAIAVFPSKDACATLGLRPFTGVSDSARRFAVFKNEAIIAVETDRCRPRSEIINILR